MLFIIIHSSFFNKLNGDILYIFTYVPIFNCFFFKNLNKYFALSLKPNFIFFQKNHQSHFYSLFFQKHFFIFNFKTDRKKLKRSEKQQPLSRLNNKKYSFFVVTTIKLLFF